MPCGSAPNGAGSPTVFVTVGRNGRECTKPLCATIADECSKMMVGVKRNVAPTNEQMSANAIQVATFFPHPKGGDGVIRDGKLVRLLMKAGVSAPDATDISEAVIVEGLWDINDDGTFSVINSQGTKITLGKMNVVTEDPIEGVGTTADPVALNIAKLIDLLKGKIGVAVDSPLEGDGTPTDHIQIDIPKLILALNNNVKVCTQDVILGDGVSGNCLRLDGNKLVALIDQTLGGDCWRTAGCSGTPTPTPTPTPSPTPTPTPSPTPTPTPTPTPSPTPTPTPTPSNLPKPGIAHPIINTPSNVMQPPPDSANWGYNGPSTGLFTPSSVFQLQGSHLTGGGVYTYPASVEAQLAFDPAIDVDGREAWDRRLKSLLTFVGATANVGKAALDGDPKYLSIFTPYGDSALGYIPIMVRPFTSGNVPFFEVVAGAEGGYGEGASNDYLAVTYVGEA